MSNLQELDALLEQTEPWHHDIPQPELGEPTWERYPAWNGTGSLSFPLKDAAVVILRGWVRLSGKKAKLVTVDAVDRKEQRMTLTVRFDDETPWMESHP